MSDKPQPPIDSIEASLGTLLRWGTLISAAVIALGGAAYLFHHGQEDPKYSAFVGEPANLRSLADIVTDVRGLGSREVIQLGLMLLVATPIARVIGALAAYSLRRDWTYVVCAALVLAALLYGLLAGWSTSR